MSFVFLLKAGGFMHLYCKATQRSFAVSSLLVCFYYVFFIVCILQHIPAYFYDLITFSTRLP